jgi:hypothetical protein
VQTVMAEFSGRRAGYFRPKPIFKMGGLKPCPRCGKYGHIGRTTCEVKTLQVAKHPADRADKEDGR